MLWWLSTHFSHVQWGKNPSPTIKVEQSRKRVWMAWVLWGWWSLSVGWVLANIAWNVVESLQYFLFSPHFFCTAFNTPIFSIAFWLFFSHPNKRWLRLTFFSLIFQTHKEDSLFRGLFSSLDPLSGHFCTEASTWWICRFVIQEGWF